MKRLLILGCSILAFTACKNENKESEETKVAENSDEQNKDLAFRKILDDVMSKQRKQELDLYRLYAKDQTFYQAFFDTMKRMASVGNLSHLNVW